MKPKNLMDKVLIKDLIGLAVRGEIKTRKVLLDAAAHARTKEISTMLTRQARRAERHRIYLEELFVIHFPDEKLKLPKTTMATPPDFSKMKRDVDIFEVLLEVLVAEALTGNTYLDLAEQFEEGTSMNCALMEFAEMERAHYRIIKLELERLKSRKK